jgi:hypothetical protein
MRFEVCQQGANLRFPVGKPRMMAMIEKPQHQLQEPQSMENLHVPFKRDRQ